MKELLQAFPVGTNLPSVVELNGEVKCGYHVDGKESQVEPEAGRKLNNQHTITNPVT